MATVTVEVRLNKLPAIAGRVPRAATEEIHAAGFRVEGKAKGRAKRQTGAMANTTANRPAGAMRTTIAAPQHYSAFLDRGTVHIPADYWFTGPVEEERSILPGKVAAAVRGAAG